ncbi:outer membrane lipoprotein chaperone LolA [Balneatrix alpica]|uniref:outer membrane lipoprotein chaperone LolA n=1 Tax=Balneatrix alpica TaxID=75684 RepID=UPI002738C429|nr:outer membrane lipoprotein chaperone LolA [Balneatrix alpica]
MFKAFLGGLLMSATLLVQAAEQPVQAFQRILAQHKTLSAEFYQVVADANGRPLQQTTGRVDLQKPDRFRWETDEPFAQLLVSDGRYLWLFDKDLEQVTKQPLDKRATHTPALLLSNDVSSLEQSFDIQGHFDGQSLWMFLLRPKDNESLFQELRISFKDEKLLEMMFADTLGQQTRISFKRVEENAMLPSQLFEFVVPKGVDLIEQP